MPFSSGIQPSATLHRPRFLFILLACGIFLLSSAFSLSLPSVTQKYILLPPKAEKPVNYTVEDLKGCFSWTWDDTDVINVETHPDDLDPSCHSRATISSISSYVGRRKTRLLATDKESGKQMKYMIFIDAIKSIRVSHQLFNLDLDAQVTFEIRAFDQEDGEFSSLGGIRFNWILEPISPEGQTGLPAHRIQSIPFDDPSFIEESTSKYTVRGVQVGQERVTAVLVEPLIGLEGVVSDSFVMTVRETVNILPASPVYILQGSTLQYTLRAVRDGRESDVSLPCPHYLWSSDDPKVAQVSVLTGTLHGLSHGRTQVTVADTRVANSMQSSTVAVVAPHSLRFFLMAHSPCGKLLPVVQDNDAIWHITTGQTYTVEVKAYAEEDPSSPIWLGEDHHLQLSLGSSSLWLLGSTPQSRHCRAIATISVQSQPGLGTIAAKISFPSTEPERTEIVLEQTVRVCAPVIIRKTLNDAPIVRLPWIPEWEPQTHTLIASEGCGLPGDYVWNSSNPQIASVTSDGLLTALESGSASVHLQSVADPLDADNVTVDVSGPAKLLIDLSSREVDVGSHVVAIVTVLDSEGFPYDNCTVLAPLISWHVTPLSGHKGPEPFRTVKGGGLSTLEAPLDATACGYIHLLASGSGSSVLRVNLRPPGAESTNLEAEKIITALSLFEVQPVSKGGGHGGFESLLKKPGSHPGPHREYFVAIGSTLKLAASGGPQPWSPSSKFEALKLSIFPDDKGLLATPEEEDSSVCYLFCRNRGYYKLTFSRGNEGGRMVDVEIAVWCDVPSSIAILVDEPYNEVEVIVSKTAAQLSNVTLVNNRSIRVAAVALNHQGIPFANASSHDLHWELSDCHQLAEWSKQGQGQKGQWERTLVLADREGQCSIHAQILGTKDRGLSKDAQKAVQAEVDSHGTALSATVNIQLVAVLSIPPQVLLFDHPDARECVAHSGGTRDLVAWLGEAQLADHSCIPMAAVKGRHAVLTVEDRGLTHPQNVTSQVLVDDVASITFVMDDGTSFPVDGITLQVGSTLPVRLLASSSQGMSFSVPQFAWMDLNAQVSNPCVSVEVGSVENALSLDSVLLSATCSGNLQLTVSLGLSRLSQSISVTAFAPLIIHPPVLVLAPGTHYRLTVTLEPSRHASFKFTSSNPASVSIPDSTMAGCISVRALGTATVLVQALSGSGRVWTQASLQVTVADPEMVIVPAVSTALRSGRNTSLYVSAANMNPLSFQQLCTDYEWTSSNSTVLSIHHGSAKGFGTTVIGLSEGAANVTATFRCKFGRKRYMSSIEMTVAAAPPVSVTSASWLLPLNYVSSPILPQSGVSYELTQKTGVTSRMEITDNGCIQTSGGRQAAWISVESVGCTEMVAFIRTAKVASMAAVDETEYLARYDISTFVGSTALLRLSFFDDTGVPFLEACSGQKRISVTTNDGDILSPSVAVYSGGSQAGINLQGVKKGEAMVQVSYLDGESSIDTFLKVRVVDEPKVNTLPEVVQRQTVDGTTKSSTVKSEPWLPSFYTIVLSLVMAVTWLSLFLVLSRGRAQGTGTALGQTSDMSQPALAFSQATPAQPFRTLEYYRDRPYLSHSPQEPSERF